MVKKNTLIGFGLLGVGALFILPSLFKNQSGGGNIILPVKGQQPTFKNIETPQSQPAFSIPENFFKNPFSTTTTTTSAPIQKSGGGAPLGGGFFNTKGDIAEQQNTVFGFNIVGENSGGMATVLPVFNPTTGKSGFTQAIFPSEVGTRLDLAPKINAPPVNWSKI